VRTRLAETYSDSLSWPLNS